MNENSPWAAVVIAWGGFFGTVTLGEALSYACALASIVASVYAILVSRARLRKIERTNEKDYSD